jgi:hypothetical protein
MPNDSSVSRAGRAPSEPRSPVGSASGQYKKRAPQLHLARYERRFGGYLESSPPPCSGSCIQTSASASLPAGRSGEAATYGGRTKGSEDRSGNSGRAFRRDITKVVEGWLPDRRPATMWRRRPTQRCSNCFAYFDNPRVDRRSTFISQAQAYASCVIRMPWNYDKIYSGTSSYREVTNRARTNGTCTANGESKALLAS